MSDKKLENEQGEQINLSDLLCPYCNDNALLVTGKEIYPHRTDLYNKEFWQCKKCDAYVGCHPNTSKPLGRLANAELRQAKMKAHRAFDPLWKKGEMKRTEAYQWLADKLEIKVSDCHIGMFNIDMCKDVIYYSNQLKADLKDLDRHLGA
jgi:hypothetical protein